MPMTIARISRERTFATLVRNLFVLEGPDADAEARRAEAVLLRANPHLANREAFRSGTVVVVPAEIGLRRTERAAAATPGLGGLLGESAERLEVVRALARDGLKREAEAAQAYLGRIGDPVFRRTVMRDGDNGARLLAEIETRQKDRLETVETRMRALEEAFEAAFAEIGRLVERTKGG
jgi:hypothetical protein